MPGFTTLGPAANGIENREMHLPSDPRKHIHSNVQLSCGDGCFILNG
jgi:hypothetical protein